MHSTLHGVAEATFGDVVLRAEAPLVLYLPTTRHDPPNHHSGITLD